MVGEANLPTIPTARAVAYAHAHAHRSVQWCLISPANLPGLHFKYGPRRTQSHTGRHCIAAGTEYLPGREPYCSLRTVPQVAWHRRPLRPLAISTSHIHTADVWFVALLWSRLRSPCCPCSSYQYPYPCYLTRSEASRSGQGRAGTVPAHRVPDGAGPSTPALHLTPADTSPYSTKPTTRGQGVTGHQAGWAGWRASSE